MLELPRVGRTIAAMTEAGILEFPARLVERLHSYETAGAESRTSLRPAGADGREPGERWPARSAGGCPTTRSRRRKRCSSAARLLIDFHLNEAAYRYPAALAEAIEVAATLAGWTEAGKSAVVQQLEAIDVPRFPLTRQ